MPHVAIEYSRGLDGAFDARALALRVNRALAEEAGAALADCKARAIPLDEVVIGAGGPGGFVHLGIAILAGRSAEQKGALADAAFAALRDALAGAAGDVQLSVEIRDMDEASYRKARAGDGA